MISATSYRWNLRDSRIPIIAAGIVLAVGFAALQAVSPKWSAMLLTAVLMTALATYKMEAALVLYTLVAFMPIGPFFSVTGSSGYSEGLYASELVLALLVFVWGVGLLFHTIRDKKLPVNKSPINTPLLLLIGISLFSFIAAQFTWDYRVPTEHRYLVSQITEIGLLCMPIAVYLLVSNSLKELRWVKAVYFSVLAVGVIGFASDCPWIHLPDFFNIRWTGLLSVPLISFLYAYILLHKEFGLKQLAAAGFLALVLAVQFRYLSWVVMWLSASVSLCVISWYRSKKLFAAVMCVALLTCLLRADLFRGVLDAERAERSLDRFNIWGSSIEMLLGRPLWGVGPGNYYPYYTHYFASVYGGATVPSAHSAYVQVLAQYGVLGLGFLCWFIVRATRVLRNSFLQESDVWRKTLFLGTLGTFIAWATISFLGEYLVGTRGNNGLANFGITVYVWILLGVAVSLCRSSETGDVSDSPSI